MTDTLLINSSGDFLEINSTGDDLLINDGVGIANDFSLAPVSILDTVDLVVIGGVTDVSFSVNIFLDPKVIEDLQLVVSMNPNLSSPVYTSTVLTPTSLDFTGFSNDKRVLKDTVTGLTANTRYYFGVKGVGGIIDSKNIGMVKTFPTPLTASNYELVISGDADSFKDVWDIDPLGVLPIAETIEKKEINSLGFIHLGDIHYKDDGSNNDPRKRNSLYTALDVNEFNSLLRRLPLIYIYDDHDSGINDNHMGDLGFEEALEGHITAYKDILPHYTLYQGASPAWVQCLGQQFTIGRVRYFLPDLRAFNSEDNTTLGDGNSYSSLLTWDQKNYIKTELVQAKTDGIKLCVFLSSRAIKEKNNTNLQQWEDHYLTELQEMMTYFGDTDIPELIVIMGDDHQAGADDGINDSIPFAANTRVASMIAGPLRADVLDASGPYSWRGVSHENRNAGVYNYMKFEIIDAGGDRVQWKATWKDTNHDTILSTVSNFDETPEVEQSSTTYVVSEDAGTVNIPINKTWLGPCKVTVDTANGTAIAGTDYTAKVSEVFNLLANRNNTTLQITIIDRSGGGPASRDFTVTISSPDGCTLGSNTVSTVTINST